jgi:hypothetical protein
VEVDLRSVQEPDTLSVRSQISKRCLELIRVRKCMEVEAEGVEW